MSSRRAFITLLGGAAAWPLAARAQQPDGMRRIGVLLGLAESDPEIRARLAAFRQGLEKRGWSEGRNVRIDFRFAPASAQMQVLAKELVALQPDVILAHSTPVTAALQRESRTIPIVFAPAADPIGSGFVASLPRPGGNITGLSELASELDAKELEMLKDVLPRATRIGVLWNPTTPSHTPGLDSVKAASQKLGLALHMASAATADEFEAALASMAQASVDGFLVVPSPLTVMQSARLAELALRFRLPGMFSAKENVEAGGLMSYGVDRNDLARRAALYIDKILKGAKPGDLPVEQASKYELVINLKTAKALGVEIPPTLLARRGD
jgi:putative ABC transport system substrate-binding protein